MPAFYRLIGWGYAGVCTAIALSALVARQRVSPPVPTPAIRTVPAPTPVVPTPAPVVASNPADAAEWFRRIKPYCNSVEITTVQRDMPPPATVEGSGYHASCLALAGRIDDARRIVDALAEQDRARAASIVFEVGHPVADAGDDRSAGPMMELVVDYVPNHYMALYHAGMAEYMLGQRDLAKRNLSAFLDNYSATDGWRSNALDVLGKLNDVNAAAADPRRPREP
jgi:hypothetical protein